MTSAQTNGKNTCAEASGGVDTVTRQFEPLKYEEKISTNLSYVTALRRVFATAQSEFQDIKLVETSTFGKCLVLDNQIQSSLSDEACYHEALVHPAMLAHPNPKRVFIGGGGEGATAREVLKHSVDRLLMADFDEKVCDFCREHLPEWNAGVWEDPRFECRYADARAELQKCAAAGEKFDVIIMDICDPLDAGPGWVLYTKEFYEECRRDYLAPGGVLVTQATCVDVAYPGNPEITDPYPILARTFEDVFAHTRAFHSQIPSFYYPWGFVMGSDAELGSPDAAAVDAALAQRKMPELKHYDGVTHLHMFSLPKGARTKLQQEKRVFSTAEPIFCSR